VAVDDPVLVLNKNGSSDMQLLSLGPAVTLTVLANDTDAESTPLTLNGVGLPDHGGGASIATGSKYLVYTPTATFTGTETFTYSVTDGQFSDTATVTATVLSGINGGNNGNVFTVTNRGECGVITITVEIPAGIVGGKKLALIYDEPAGGNSIPNGGLLPVCNLFKLTAWLGSLPLDPPTFQEPLTMTFDYAGTNVSAGEQGLNLYRRDEASWSGEGISVVERNATADRLTLTLNQAAEFRLFQSTAIYLPLIMKGYISAPDLVVQSVTPATDNVEVVIANIGTGPVIDAFWMDVYLNPDTPPTGVNQIWQQLGSQGLAWGITAEALPLAPGQTLTLTVGDAYYRPDSSFVTWPLAAGLPVYAQVDSVNHNTTYGAALEIHEIANQPYNNIFATTSNSEAIGTVLPAFSEKEYGAGPNNLPERR
jgi:hypothetical protein